jgi:hypothetical protein
LANKGSIFNDKLFNCIKRISVINGFDHNFCALKCLVLARQSALQRSQGARALWRSKLNQAEKRSKQDDKCSVHDVLQLFFMVLFAAFFRVGLLQKETGE